MMTQTHHFYFNFYRVNPFLQSGQMGASLRWLITTAKMCRPRPIKSQSYCQIVISIQYVCYTQTTRIDKSELIFSISFLFVSLSREFSLVNTGEYFLSLCALGAANLVRSNISILRRH